MSRSVITTLGAVVAMAVGCTREAVVSAGKTGEERGTVGASWMTRLGRETEIADYIAYLDRLHAADGAGPGAVHLLGFSQGVATACRWAVLGRARPRTLVLWAGDVPPDLDWDRAREALATTRVIQVAGTGDPYLPRDRVEADTGTLREHGIAAEVLWFEGGHHLKSGLLREIAETSGS